MADANTSPCFYEFFAGGGMARAGLAGWTCLFANDFDAKKARSYADNWGADHIRCADIHTLAAADLPGRAGLVWASFPCQDVSLAGAGRGLAGARSGAFFGLTKLLEDLSAGGRAPKMVALENVVGLLTSNGGADFSAVCAALAALRYRFGALVMDAARFTPQSRPRLVVVALHEDAPLDPSLAGESPSPDWTAPALERAAAALPADLAERFVWWRLPPAPRRNSDLASLLEPDDRVVWRPRADTARLLALMAPHQRARLEALLRSGGRHVGTVFRRMRRDETGARVQRAEARFDGVAGCLRTPAGGSSRQTLIVVEGGEIRTRLISPREAARLMGLPDSYVLPAGATEALKLAGDGVVAPLVRFLSDHLLLPLARGRAAVAA